MERSEYAANLALQEYRNNPVPDLYEYRRRTMQFEAPETCREPAQFDRSGGIS